jgi:rRNA-processing protein FCF1
MLFVAPDTNFILHFKPIAEIGPNELGLASGYTWLIVGQVLRELDIRKGTGDKTLRKRARKSAKELEQVETDCTIYKTGCGVKTHFRTRPFDFEARGLLPNEGDDKIIADIIDFKSTHSQDDVILLTDDASMRMRARGYGIHVIDPDDVDPAGALKRPELEDERDEKIRHLEEREQALSATQPDVDFGFQDGSRELSCKVYSFAPGALEELIEKSVSPEEPQEAVAFGPALLPAFFRPNQEYDAQLARYHEELDSYASELWVADYRTVEIAPALFSRNGIQPSAVQVTVSFTTNGEVVKEPGEPTRPKRPERFLALGLGGTARIDLSSLARELNYEAPNMREPRISRSGSSVTVDYTLVRIAQDAATHLEPFFIRFSQAPDPPDAIELHYEVRAQNMNIVRRGRLLVRIERSQKQVPADFLLDRSS